MNQMVRFQSASNIAVFCVGVCQSVLFLQLPSMASP